MDFSEEQIKEIDYLVEFILEYKREGFSRLRIWKELRNSCSRKDILVHAFRKLGMVG